LQLIVAKAQVAINYSKEKEIRRYGTKAEKITTFDPNAEKIIASPQVRGGIGESP
jgi:hypothetical protein